MRTGHLTGDELDALLLGEEVDRGAAEHAAACVPCRRRLVTLRRALSPQGELDPTPMARERAREAALAAWATPRPVPRPVWWWAAAAALVAALALPLLTFHPPRGGEVDAAEVLAQVDALLAGDPVGVAFSAEVVTALSAAEEVAAGGNPS